MTVEHLRLCLEDATNLGGRKTVIQSFRCFAHKTFVNVKFIFSFHLKLIALSCEISLSREALELSQSFVVEEEQANLQPSW